MDRAGRNRPSRRNACNAVVVVYYITLCLASLCGPGWSTCPEPAPVGNAYRKLHPDRVTYECFETYDHRQGDLTRSCHDASQTYLGTPPVCTLNCSAPPDDPGADVDSLNDTLAFDKVFYRCKTGFVGSGFASADCGNKNGRWNYSALNCQRPNSILVSGSAVLEPYDPTVDPNVVLDGSVATWFDLQPGSTLTVNTTTIYGQRMEVTKIKLSFKVNTADTYVQCLLTHRGAEYIGTKRMTESGECQRWDSQTPHSHNLTDDSLFPGDGSATNASNYCRNVGDAQGGPWCFTTDPTQREQVCNVKKVCAAVSVKTVLVNMDGEEDTDDCFTSYENKAINLLDATESIKEITRDCRPSSSDIVPPFGHQLQIHLMSSPVNFMLQLYTVEAFGREYIGGCSQALGYWRLEVVGDPPSRPGLGTNVTYRCKDDYHYRGGSLVSVCKDNRKWSDIDIHQCTDEVNHASLPGVAVLASGAVVGAYLNDDNPLTCVKPFDTTSPSPFPINVTLKGPLEVAEVVITAEGNQSYDVPLDVNVVLGGRWWPCQQLSVGPGGTFASSCPFRPVADTVVLSYPGTNTPDLLTNFSLCEIKVFGRNLTVGLECFREERGEDYKGRWSTTAAGLPCQRWDSLFPHYHVFNDSRLFPDQSIAEAADYCRNPLDPGSGGRSSEKRPWCFTQDDDTRWGYCPLFVCDNICRLREDGITYKGNIKLTATGRNCQQWPNYDSPAGSMSRPHYYSKDSDGRDCRNPHGSQSQPWCFNSTDPVQHEKCDVPMCPLATDTIDFEYLDPNNASSTPDWLQDSELIVRECNRFNFGMSSFNSYHDVTPLLPSQCSDIHGRIGFFCSFRNASGAGMWRYFWFNCSSEPETTTQAVPTTPMADSCDCEEMCTFNLTAEELAASVERIKKELLVDKSTLSATIRKKQSATDQRPSAVTTGTFGVALVAVCLLFIISSDLISVVQWFQRRYPRAKTATTGDES